MTSIDSQLPRVASPAAARALVQEARARIHGAVRYTPLLDVGQIAGAHVRLKLECMQLGGSFKARGATNRILASEYETACVVAASGGNHGIAVATAATRAGRESVIYVPESTPPLKAALIKQAGGRVVRVEGTFVRAEALAREHAQDDGVLFVHPFDDPLVVAGQGTVALEIVEAWPKVDLVIVAVGGGGLAAGIVQATDQAFDVITVEPAACPTLARARDAGAPTIVEVSGVAVDALGAPILGTIAWETLATLRHPPVLVSESAIVEARHELWQRFRIAVEPGAATGWAALRSLSEETIRGRAVAVVVCGANSDPSGLFDA